jgi:anti-sigma regulatory factor (Ser/Thr protein kinase)/ActR/RegA family two-component response regulator
MKDVDVKQVADRAAQSAGQPLEAGRAILNALVNLIHFELMQGNRVILPEIIALSYSDSGALQTESLVIDENGEVTPLEPVGPVVPSGLPAPPAAAPAMSATPGGTIMIPTIVPAPGEPMAAPVAAATVPAAVMAPAANKVLFVASRLDPFTNTVVQEMSAANYVVSTVEGGDAAIQRVEQDEPDLVIVDGKITNFLELIREVKLNPRNGIMSVVTIYPQGTDPNRVAGLKVCDDEVIQEPYEARDLLSLAGTELGRISEERAFFEQEIHYQFATSEEWIEQANDLIARLIDGAGIDEEKAASLSVAFREAVDNAARHGNKNQENRIIDIIYLLDKQKVTVTVEDEGDGFDTELYLTRGIQGNAVAAARERNQAGRVGGLGIMLMLKCLDNLEYNNVGNLVKLTKYR